ncbi:GAF domain-containing protein [Nocardia sp. NPDC057030]|uniref:GAF domain-containing protein n=1 Tax=unclassified Nocardia TaxID=2637762 RepID=UPI003634B962
MDTTQTRLAFAELTATLTTDFDVPSLLYLVARHARECFDAYSAVVVLLDGRGNAGTGRTRIVAEALREGYSADPRLHAIGPGCTSARYGAVTMIADLGARNETSWPNYRRYAVKAGMRAVRAYPVTTLAMPLGSLIVHTDDPWGTARPNEFGQTLADLTAIALSLGRIDRRRTSTIETVQAVLDGTTMIAFAIGILAQYFRMDVDHARTRLNRLARAHDTTPTAHARVIVAAQNNHPADPAKSGALHSPETPDAPRQFDN